MNEIVYFEINNWFKFRDFPPDEIFCKWIRDNQFENDEWCKENKLCVMYGPIDMSMNYCIAAPKSWVLENCPNLLSDKEYSYQTYGYDFEKKQDTIEDKTKKYSDFLCFPDEDGDVYGHIADDWCFPEYKEENFGVTRNDSWWESAYDGEEEDDEYYDEEYLKY